MDLGRKIRTGVEQEPVEAPTFFPVKKLEPQPVPGFSPDFTPVPVVQPARQR